MAQSKHFGVFEKDGHVDQVADSPSMAVDLAFRGWSEKKPATAKPEDAANAATTGGGDVAGDSAPTADTTESSTRNNTRNR